LGWSGTESSITEATTGLLYQRRMTLDEDAYVAVGGMIGRRNRSTRRKPVAVPLCPPQIPYDLTRARNWAADVESWRLIARATARPLERFSIPCDLLSEGKV
jgi:hypothetical protein